LFGNNTVDNGFFRSAICVFRNLLGHECVEIGNQFLHSAQRIIEAGEFRTLVPSLKEPFGWCLVTELRLPGKQIEMRLHFFDDAFGGTSRLGFKIPAFVPKPIVRNVRKSRQVVKAAVVS
jgi:hypothetical protein